MRMRRGRGNTQSEVRYRPNIAFAAFLQAKRGQKATPAAHAPALQRQESERRRETGRGPAGGRRTGERRAGTDSGARGGWHCRDRIDCKNRVYGLWFTGLWSMDRVVLDKTLVYWTRVYGLWSMVYGLWSMVYGLLDKGLWSMVYWFMVYGQGL
jgi:hypothetical protein